MVQVLVEDDKGVVWVLVADTSPSQVDHHALAWTVRIPPSIRVVSSNPPLLCQTSWRYLRGRFLASLHPADFGESLRSLEV